MPAWAVGAWAEGAWEGTAWAQVSVAQPDQISGGWEQVTYKRRKTDDDVRQERIRLGIFPPDQPTPVILPKQVQPERELTKAEINAIKARVQNELDLEIALYLKAIEKRRQQMINLILILDAA